MDAKRQSFVSALLVGAERESRLLLHEIFRNAGWHLFQAPGRKRALLYLERRPVQVVIADGDFSDWHWKQVWRDLQRLPHPPQLVVTSRLCDESLWSEVLNWGGYDVLAEPFRRDEVERVIAAARRHFEGWPTPAPRGRAMAAS